MSDSGRSKEESPRKGSTSSSTTTTSSSGGRKDRLLDKMNKISSWLSTSEPSAHALKQHKKEAFQRAGIPLKDTEANVKLHAPIGQIPPDAIKPSAGPNPEEIIRRKAEQRRKLKEKQGRHQQQHEQQRGRQHSTTSPSASASGSASFSGASGSILTPSLSGYSSSMSGPDSSMYVPGDDDDFGANGWGPR